MFFPISERLMSLSAEAEGDINPVFAKIDRVVQYNQDKVLRAFVDHRVSEACFAHTTGYGYGDVGRDTLDEIYAQVFGAEAALVRHNIVNGTQAIATALYGVLRPGDTLLAATGKPYDTLEEVIGINGADGSGSLRDFGVSYVQADLKDGKVDLASVKHALKTQRVKAVLIQRSKGYDWRESLSVDQIGALIAEIRVVDPNAICIVDNCYGEFTETREPSECDADLVVGSLIKNVGGGLAQSGGYLVGKSRYVKLCAYRQTAPGLGRECGATLGQTRVMYQGLFLAPHVVGQALKAAVYTSAVMEKLGYDVNPKPLDRRSDLIQAIRFGAPEPLIAYIQAIQEASPVDSFVRPEPWDMPGYQHQVIMAAGTFVSGASIELSADAPIKEPYVAFVQGGLTYESAKTALLHAANRLLSQRGENE